ncbi:MAG: MEDS domain-containing protein [Gemmatimonadaceae bacterium]
MRTTRKLPRKTKTVELGIHGEHVSPGDHIALLWETPEEFTGAVGFLEVAIRGPEHAVIFGHPEANDRVCEILTARGHDVLALQRQGKLTILMGVPKGDHMLDSIASAFQAAIDSGAKLIRLLGNIGWGHENWPVEQEILAFEAKVTAAARAFPCVVLCLYDVQALSGRIIVHGAYKTHPLTICGNVLRENPYHVPLERFLDGMNAGAPV